MWTSIRRTSDGSNRNLPPRSWRGIYVQLTKLGLAKLRQLADVHRTELQTVGPLLVGLLEQVTGTSGHE